MAQITSMKRKLAAEEAVRILKKHVAAVTDATHDARVESDDTGKHIVLYVEQYNPQDSLSPLLRDSLGVLSEYYWRLVTIKVPIGAVEIIMSSSLN